MYRKIINLSGNITYIVAGPATTIALLLSSFPDVVKKIDRVVYMGGGITHGNVTPFAEFNTYNDPESLYISLNAKVESIIFPLEGLEDISFDAAHVKKVREANEHMGYVLGELLDEIIIASLAWNQKPNSYDDGVLPVLVKEGYCKKMRSASWDIVLDGEKRGKTVFNWLDDFDTPEISGVGEKMGGSNRHAKSIVKVCTGTRREDLWEMLFEILKETRDVHHGFVHSLR
jgi:inosine-uridine nucleoside N-ribohydrolase